MEIKKMYIDLNTCLIEMSQNFNRLKTIDLKICDLQRSTPEIKKYMKAESASIELTIQQFANDLDFEQINEVEEWIDSVFYELERRKQEHRDKTEQWKSAGNAIVSGVLKFSWRMINK